MQIYTAVFSKSHALVHAMLLNKKLGMAAQTELQLIVCAGMQQVAKEAGKKQQAHFL